MCVEPETETGHLQMKEIQVNPDEVMKIVEINIRKAPAPDSVAR